LNVLHLSLQDPVLCLERSVIDSSPEVLLSEVCQGRFYPFDIQAVVWLGALVRQGFKDRLAPVTVEFHASQDLVGEFLLYPALHGDVHQMLGEDRRQGQGIRP